MSRVAWSRKCHLHLLAGGVVVAHRFRLSIRTVKAFAFQELLVALAGKGGKEAARCHRVYEELVSPPVVAQRAALIFGRRCPNDVSDSADKQVRAAGLHATAIRIEIYVTHRLPAAEPAENQVFAIRVNHI